MKKLVLLISSFFLVAVLFAQQIPARPNPPRLVNDFVGLLTTDQRDSLERKLVAYDDSTSNQIAIVIVGTLNDYDPVDYAVKLGREWGVGGKEHNNGVIVLISTGADGSQRKAFIAPGYGLEGAIPDITAKEIVDNELVPYLKEKDYFRGLNHSVDALIQAAAGEYTAPEGYHQKKGKPGGSFLPIIVVIIIIIISIIRRGGGGGGMMSRRGYRGRGIPPIWWFPTGGGGGGGGWSGGGGSSGGFGGFGGGSFGGGGAGGNW
jgi:uncharacterized protein